MHMVFYVTVSRQNGVCNVTHVCFFLRLITFAFELSKLVLAYGFFFLAFFYDCAGFLSLSCCGETFSYFHCEN